MDAVSRINLNTKIENWISRLALLGEFTRDDMEELRSHLMDHIDDLIEEGISPDHAFQLSLARMGDAEFLVKQYAKRRTWLKLSLLACAAYVKTNTSKKSIVFSLMFLLLTAGGICGLHCPNKKAIHTFAVPAASANDSVKVMHK